MRNSPQHQHILSSSPQHAGSDELHGLINPWLWRTGNSLSCWLWHLMLLHFCDLSTSSISLMLWYVHLPAFSSKMLLVSQSHPWPSSANQTLPAMPSEASAAWSSNHSAAGLASLCWLDLMCFCMPPAPCKQWQNGHNLHHFAWCDCIAGAGLDLSPLNQTSWSKQLLFDGNLCVRCPKSHSISSLMNLSQAMSNVEECGLGLGKGASPHLMQSSKCLPGHSEMLKCLIFTGQRGAQSGHQSWIQHLHLIRNLQAVSHPLPSCN